MESATQFKSKLGFVAAAAGCAVGLGNIWKFPFEVGESGGAAFLLLYLVFCFVLCFPILVAEIAIGRSSGKNPASAFRKLGHKNWTLLGILYVLVATTILSFYAVVSGWALSYFIDISRGNFDIGDQFSLLAGDFNRSAFYSGQFLLITGIIVANGINNGIEKMSRIMMPLLIVLILVMVFYAISLPNASAGLRFYLIPDFSKIRLGVVLNALGHAFFSLSLGLGALITYGSYFGKKQSILQSAALITFADVGIAFLAGLMLFPLVFSQGLDTHGGAGLVFMTLPRVFGEIGGFWGQFSGSAFFLLLTLAALTSAVSLLEIPVSFLIDKTKLNRPLAVALVVVVVFIIGVPSLMANGSSQYFTHFIRYMGAEESVDFMTFISDLSSNTFLPAGGLLISLFVGYTWKKRRLYKELMTGSRLKISYPIIRYVDFSLKFICPAVLGIIFTLTILERFMGITLM